MMPLADSFRTNLVESEGPIFSVDDAAFSNVSATPEITGTDTLWSSIVSMLPLETKPAMSPHLVFAVLAEVRARQQRALS